MNESLKHLLRFYTGADYLIINALLWGNKSDLEQGIKAVHWNNTGVISEAKEMTPEVRFGVSKEEGQRLLDAYICRTPDLLTKATMAEIINTAISDIYSICNHMQPATEEILLYRNVEEKYAIKNPVAGSLVDLKGITSTSTTGQEIDYGNGHKITCCKYVIKVPIGIPMLVVENDYRNENEVILPPMQYRVVDVCEDEVCKRLNLDAIKTLDIDALLQEAKI